MFPIRSWSCSWSHQGGHKDEVSLEVSRIPFIPAALWSALYLCYLGSKAIEIISEGQAVLVISQKLGSCEIPLLNTLGVIYQRLLHAQNTSLFSSVHSVSSVGTCCVALAPSIQGPRPRLFLSCPYSNQRHFGVQRPDIGLRPTSESQRRKHRENKSRNCPPVLPYLKWPRFIPFAKLGGVSPLKQFLKPWESPREELLHLGKGTVSCAHRPAGTRRIGSKGCVWEVGGLVVCGAEKHVDEVPGWEISQSQLDTSSEGSHYK